MLQQRNHNYVVKDGKKGKPQAPPIQFDLHTHGVMLSGIVCPYRQALSPEEVNASSPLLEPSLGCVPASPLLSGISQSHKWRTFPLADHSNTPTITTLWRTNFPYHQRFTARSV